MKLTREQNEQRLKWIQDNYINGDKTQEEVAEYLGITIGALKNYFYNHNINKKVVYNKKKKMALTMIKNGKSIKDVAKEINSTPQYVYYIMTSEAKRMRGLK